MKTFIMRLMKGLQYFVLLIVILIGGRIVLFTNDMLRDVVYTEAGDARRRLFHRRAMEVLESAKDSAAVLATHARAAGLAQAAFCHSLAAGQEALRISALNDSIVYFERAHQFVREELLPDMPGEADLRDLYTQLSRTYKLSGQTENALAVDAERDRLS